MIGARVDHRIDPLCAASLYHYYRKNAGQIPRRAEPRCRRPAESSSSCCDPVPRESVAFAGCMTKSARRSWRAGSQQARDCPRRASSPRGTAWLAGRSWELSTNSARKVTLPAALGMARSSKRCFELRARPWHRSRTSAPSRTRRCQLAVASWQATHFPSSGPITVSRPSGWIVRPSTAFH